MVRRVAPSKEGRRGSATRSLVALQVPTSTRACSLRFRCRPATALFGGASGADQHPRVRFSCRSTPAPSRRQAPEALRDKKTRCRAGSPLYRFGSVRLRRPAIQNDDRASRCRRIEFRVGRAWKTHPPGTRRHTRRCRRRGCLQAELGSVKTGQLKRHGAVALWATEAPNKCDWRTVQRAPDPFARSCLGSVVRVRGRTWTVPSLPPRNTRRALTHALDLGAAGSGDYARVGTEGDKFGSSFRKRRKCTT